MSVYPNTIRSYGWIAFSLIGTRLLHPGMNQLLLDLSGPKVAQEANGACHLHCGVPSVELPVVSGCFSRLDMDHLWIIITIAFTSSLDPYFDSQHKGELMILLGSAVKQVLFLFRMTLK